MAAARLEAVVVNENADEFPGMLADVGTAKSGEELVNDADIPAIGAAGEILPVHDAFCPGTRVDGEHVMDVIEYVTVDTILKLTGRLTAPADAVIVAVCGGVVEE